MNFKRYQQLTEQVHFHNDFHTLGVPRSQMPQIKSYKIEAFEEFLKAMGYSIRVTKMPVDKLKLTQADIHMNKVVGMAQNINQVKQKYVIVSSDGYILDGHHRIFALQMTHPKQQVPVHQVNMKIRDLLKLADKFQGTTKENLV